MAVQLQSAVLTEILSACWDPLRFTHFRQKKKGDIFSTSIIWSLVSWMMVPHVLVKQNNNKYIIYSWIYTNSFFYPYTCKLLLYVHNLRGTFNSSQVKCVYFGLIYLKNIFTNYAQSPSSFCWKIVIKHQNPSITLPFQVEILIYYIILVWAKSHQI